MGNDELLTAFLAENRRLRELLVLHGISTDPPETVVETPKPVAPTLSGTEKICIFRNLFEEKTRNGILSTLSRSSEVMSPDAERPKLFWTESGRCFPVIIAGKIDVLPAEWGQMGQITRCRMLPLIAQVIDGALQVGRIP